MSSRFVSQLLNYGLKVAAGCLLVAPSLEAVPIDRVSVDSAGRERPGRSAEPAISGDGSVVVFSTTARFGRDTNGRPDVFAKNRATGLLERISDERGGDLPSVSSDGNFVVYRSLEDLPKVRKFDRRSTGPRNSVSFPFAGGQSRRFGDAGVITPNGAWTAYLFRPEPANTTQTGNMVNVHSSVAGVTFDDPQQNFAAGLRDAFRAVATNDRNFVAWVTSEPFRASDTNEGRDVFVSNGSTTRWISALPGNVSAAEASFDVAFSADGSRLVFLSDAALLPGDTDGRTSIYFASSADGFASLTYLPTSVRPLALGPQGASAVGTIAYTAAGPVGRPILHLTDYAGLSKAVTPASAIIGAPALSADGSSLAFASGAALISTDRNAAPDVYVADVSSLFGHIRRPEPVPVFGNLAEGQRINANQTFAVNASASDPSGTIREMAIEVNGTFLARVNGATLTQNINLPVGTHRVTIRAYNDAYVGGERSVTILAQPPSNTRGLASATDVVTTTAADGSLTWAGNVRVENRTTTARNFRVTLTIAPTPAFVGPNRTPQDGEGFSDLRLLPNRAEQVGFSSTVFNVAANGSALVPAEVILPAPEVIGNGLQGIGWSLIGILTEELAGGPVVAARQTLFVHLPILSEKTNGPNGGVTNPDNPLADGAFTPPAMTGFTVNVPPSVPEQTVRTLTATATFASGPPKPCGPTFQIISAGDAATITRAGVLATKNISTPTMVRVRAELSGLPPVEVNIRVVPVVPIVSVAAVDKIASESGDPGRFRITRSAALQEEVTVAFTVSGTAEEGADFAPLQRSVTFPPRATRAFLDLLPVDNAVFGGMKTVTLTLEPDAAYRLGSARSATVRILDDEPPLPRQADLVLRAGNIRVGANVFEAVSPLRPLTQTLRRATRAGSKITLLLEMTHIGTEPGQYRFRGAPDFSGFAVRYLDGQTDVTADASGGGTDGGYRFALEPRGRKIIKVQVTTTSAAPPGFLQVLPFDLREESGDPVLALPDAAEVVLMRRP